MTKFTTINDAINHIADVMALDTDGATWVYETSDCPCWSDDEFIDYDFLSDEKAVSIAAEYVK